MATLVLGGVGAAIGATIPGVGWAIGLEVGAALGSFFDQPAEGQKLSDLKISGSSYGVAVPRVWGQYRLGANIIWAATDSHGNHLVQHDGSSGGKGGKGGLTQYTYSCTWATQVCVGTFTFPDGSQVFRNPTVKRIWFDDLKVYDVVNYNGILKLNENFFIYQGTETQTADPTIAAHDGASISPAYRGYCYLVFKDIDLTPFSQRVPSVSVEVWTDDDGAGNGHMFLSTVVSDLCRSTGVTAAQLDLSLMGGVEVVGCCETNQTSADETLKNILTCYQFDMVEVDGLIRFVPRGQAEVATINPNDLGSKTGDAHDENVNYTRVRKMLTDLPGRFDLSFYDSGAYFENATVIEIRQSLNISNTTQIQTPCALDPTTARQIAAWHLDDAWTGKDEYSWKLPYRYLNLIPSDPISFPTSFGYVRLRVTEVGLSPVGEMQFKGVLDASNVVTQTITGASGPAGTQVLTTPVAALFEVWSGTEIQDADQGEPGFYVAAAGSDPSQSWPGGTIYYSLDSGVTYITGPTVRGASTFGVTTNTLAAGTTPNAFDTTDTLAVELSTTGTLTTTSDANMLAGQNQAYVGSEILGFSNAALGTGTGYYNLTRLYRGERSSSMSGHATGERFVLLDKTITRQNVPASSVGSTVLVKVVSQNQTLADVTAQSVVIASPSPTSTSTLAAAMVVPNFLNAPVRILDTAATSGATVVTTGAFTTLNLSTSLPAGARYAMMTIYLNDSSGVTTFKLVQMRPTGGGITLTLAGAESGAGGDTTAPITQAPLVPINPGSLCVDYYIDAGLSVQVDLVGYWT